MKKFMELWTFEWNRAKRFYGSVGFCDGFTGFMQSSTNTISGKTDMRTTGNRTMLHYPNNICRTMGILRWRM